MKECIQNNPEQHLASGRKDAPLAQRPRYYLSPVDYDACRKGYVPPATHILIHEIMFNEARPIISADNGETGAFWLVIRGPMFPNRALRKQLTELLFMLGEDEPVPDGAARVHAQAADKSGSKQ